LLEAGAQVECVGLGLGGEPQWQPRRPVGSVRDCLLSSWWWQCGGEQKLRVAVADCVIQAHYLLCDFPPSPQ